MPSITQSLASFVVRTRFEDLPLHAVERAKVHFLDWIAACHGGIATAPGRVFLEHARQNPEPGSLTAFGLSDKRGAHQASLINGVLSKASQLDDMDRASLVHPASTVSPAAFAAAELRGRSGADLLRAVVLGYEVASRIGEAIGTNHYDCWHNTGTCGIFGAATAAGILLGLNEGELVGALGNAGTQSAGLRQCVHDDLEFGLFLHSGKAASDGFLSAQLAALGYHGAPRILEGSSGLFSAASDNPQPEVALEGLDRPLSRFRIEQVSLKRWPCCMHSHTAVRAAMAVSQQVAPEDIERITVSTCRQTMSMTDRPRPRTVQDARFSLQFGVAVASVFGQLEARHFAEEYLKDPGVVSAMERVRVQHAPDLEQYYPRRWPARVAARSRHGALVEETVLDCPGGPEQPLGLDDVAEKLRESASGTLSPRAMERLVTLVSRLEALESLAGLCGPAPDVARPG